MKISLNQTEICQTLLDFHAQRLAPKGSERERIKAHVTLFCDPKDDTFYAELEYEGPAE